MVHTFKLLGKGFAVDSAAGSVHILDDLAFAAVSDFEKMPKDRLIASLITKFSDSGVTRADAEECVDEIEELKSAGALFAADDFGEIASTVKAGAPIIKALCLHVAHTCNLSCEYCFASQGKFHGERAMMSYETGRRALDFLIENSGTRRNLEVDFFGGEPLMNFGVVRDLVAYAREAEKGANKNFRFTLTTNGVLIDDEVIDFCNREMSNVVLSLDGRKSVHDRFRVDYAGRGSFDVVVPKFQRLVAARGGKNYYIRGTFTHLNPDFLSDVEEMLNLGFRELSMEPVVAAKGDPFALTPDDEEIVMREYERLAELMLKKDEEGDPFTFYHYMLDLKGGPCIYKRIMGCGSGTEYLAVTPWGDLYPCHRFVGEEKYKMGDVWQGVTNLAARNEFASVNVYAREKCRDCWARLYCSGGCAANAYYSSGSIGGVYESGCKLFRKRMECAIALAAIRQEKANENADN